MFNQVIIIGKGLIGGSIGLGLASHCKSISYIDKEFGCIKDVADADLIIISTPVLAMPEILQEIKPFLKPDAIIMDVASTKTFVLEQAQVILGQNFAQFIGAHPIAGKETSGFTAAEVNLFNHKPVILIPTPKTDARALATIKKLWEVLGAKVYEMSAQAHDLAFAKYSHLSNIVSFLLQHQSQNTPILPPELLPPSFKDMTRLAKSDPTMWRDICLSNQTAIIENLNIFIDAAIQFKAILQQGDPQILLGFFNKK